MEENDKLTGYNLSRRWFDFCFENTGKVKPVHTALFFFAIEHCNRLGWKKDFGLPTTMTMEAIGVGSYNTYIKAFSDIIDWKFFILIKKSFNQYSSNVIALSINDEANDKALDKALMKQMTKHSIKQVESTEQSIDSINKQITIKPVNKKPRTKTADLKKIKSVHPSFSVIKDLFLQNFESYGSGEYYWNAIDGTKTNSIIKKLSFKIREKYPDVSEDDLPEKINTSFKFILDQISIMNDTFVKDNISMSLIDSKFNQIILKITQKNGKPTTTDKAKQNLSEVFSRINSQ